MPKYADLEVRISNGILWVGSEAYPLKHVTRVRALTLRPERGAAVRRYVKSVLTWVLPGATAATVLFVGVGSNIPAITVVAAVLGAIAVTTAKLASSLHRTLYELVVETDSDSHRPFVSADAEAVTEFVLRITDAIGNPHAEYRGRVGVLHIGDNINAHHNAAVAVGKVIHSVKSARTGGPASPVADGFATVPVTIYLADEAAHEEVEMAVETLLRSARLYVVERDDPILGSWFRRMSAGGRGTLRSSIAREAGAVAAHAFEARLVLARDAAVTATMMQNLGPVLASLQSTKDAVIRVGALLVVKVEWVVAVHQLTSAQQLRLDHQPRLLTSPRDILRALELPDESGGTRESLGDAL